MKFDKRISSDLRDVYTLYCRNNDNLLGIEVYASNDIDDFNDLDRCKKGKVDYIDPVHGYAVKIDSENTCFFNFVIPAMCVKEKTLRPYTLEELPIKVCDIIYLKNKNSEIIERCLCISISSEGNQIKSITLGVNSYSIQELFEKYVWRHSDLWDFQPFGVAV